MPPPADSSLDYRRTHNLLLISRLLSQKDAASPFTLILDTLSQSAKPLLFEYIARARAAKINVIYVSFETFTIPDGITTVIHTHGKSVAELQTAIAAAVKKAPDSRALLILDALNTLSSSKPKSLAPFLSSLLAPTTTLVGVYHTDVPLCLPAEASADAYPDSAPDPLTLLKYFCTTLIKVHSIKHVLARKAARDRAEREPVFGIDEGIEGILVGFGSNAPEGMVLEMEYRRKSGRGVEEWFYLPLQEAEAKRLGSSTLPGGVVEKTILLEDHPEWRVSEQVRGMDMESDGEEEPTSTFELGLTERQRKARDEVVLPYFDAQKPGGIGGGGAILFTPDREIDDFDEEEDEI
ncbi:Elongator complex protein 5 [Geopyxis carbonaria]|nr:Elongator complex protein 5 [Geopyxis carbonaria]